MRESVTERVLFGMHLGNTHARVAVVNPGGEVRLFFFNVLGRKEPSLGCTHGHVDGHLVPHDEIGRWQGGPRIRLDLASLRRDARQDTVVTPAELLERVLHRILVQVLLEGEWMRHAVVSVPDCLEREQKEVLVRTARGIGLPVKRIIPHSEAALFAHGYPDLPREEVLGLVRIGASSLSVRLCRLSDGRIHTLANRTAQGVGTEQLDHLLCERLFDLIQERHQRDVRSDPDAAARIRKKLETARTFFRPGTPFNFNAGVAKEPLAVAPQEALEAVAPLHQAIGDVLRTTASEAGLRPGTIVRTLIAGGGFRVPFLVHAVEQALGGKVSFPPVPPEEVIARGAALNGYFYRHGKPPYRKTGMADIPEATVVGAATVPLPALEKTKITRVARTYVIALRTSEEEGKTLRFENQDEISIGRKADAQALFQTSAVSRSHAKIEFHDGTFFIIDRSANGTFLNGERLVKWQRRKIKQGDTIHLTSPDGPWIKIEAIH